MVLQEEDPPLLALPLYPGQWSHLSLPSPWPCMEFLSYLYELCHLMLQFFPLKKQEKFLIAADVKCIKSRWTGRFVTCCLLGADGCWRYKEVSRRPGWFLCAFEVLPTRLMPDNVCLLLVRGHNRLSALILALERLFCRLPQVEHPPCAPSALSAVRADDGWHRADWTKAICSPM